MDRNHCPRRVRLSPFLAAGIGVLAAAGLLANSAVAGGALPTGGQFIAGNGAISTSGNALTVQQTGRAGIIDWRSFSIGTGNSVFFANGNGATLNRVTGAGGSSIGGFLGASGSVYLINPNGVVINSSGRVLTNGSFVASSRDIANGAFMANGGSQSFNGNSNGDVTNKGSITSTGGDVVLIGRSAANGGTINTPNGTTALAAGNQVLLQPADGDPRISVAMGNGNTINTGTIAAAQAELRAANGNVYALAGNGGGTINATGVANIGGHVWLVANGGSVTVSGAVSAANANGSGGAVTAEGRQVAVSGTVNASATRQAADGGAVKIVATDTTSVTGSIKAEAGGTGKGGLIETSGEHVKIADSAKISTRSPGGRTGTWLIDPNDFTIAASGGDITGATLSSNLASNDVTILSSSGATAGNGDIFVNDAVSWSSAHSLTLSAFRNIDINAGITVGGAGGLSLVTGTGGAGDYNIARGNSIDFTGGSGSGASLTINATPYALLYSMADVQAIGASDSALQGNYALATSLDASSTSSWTPIGIHLDAFHDDNQNETVLNGGNGFSGVFAGLGHTISNLSVTQPVSNGRLGPIGPYYNGLFGVAGGSTLTGIIKDIGIIDGDFHGGDYTGELAGYSRGIISNAYATGTVTSQNNSPPKQLAALLAKTRERSTGPTPMWTLTDIDTLAVWPA